MRCIHTWGLLYTDEKEKRHFKTEYETKIKTLIENLAY